METALVSVQNVQKRFCRKFKKSLWYGVGDIVSEFTLWRGAAQARLRSDEFWAVNNVSFDLRRGECLGLIGRNGAGKTTLLKMINGLIRPDAGRIEIKGQVGAMIALGAGFNPILTGRENIYISGSLRGLKRQQIDQQLEEIIDFAEIGEAIDMPVQGYSSGMTVRLGFAVTAALSPDIMLIDEVLAVGDVAFRAKCYRRIDQLRRTAAIILVSHNMEQIGNACDRVIVMDRGQVAIDGPVDKGVEVYDRLNESTSGGEEKPMRRVSLPVEAAELVLPPSVAQGTSLTAALDLRLTAPVTQISLRIKIVSPEGTTVAEISAQNLAVNLGAGANRVLIGSEKLFLRPGAYVVGLSVSIPGVLEPIIQHWRAYKLLIDGAPNSRGTHWQLPARVTLADVHAGASPFPAHHAS